MQILVNNSYSAFCSTTVDLPVESMDEVNSWYVKWGTFHYTLDGEKWHEVDLHEDADAIDWKRPSDSSVTDEDFNDLEVTR